MAASFIIDNLNQDISGLNSSQKISDKIKTFRKDDLKIDTRNEESFENLLNKESGMNNNTDNIEINIEIKTDKNDVKEQSGDNNDEKYSDKKINSEDEKDKNGLKKDKERIDNINYLFFKNDKDLNSKEIVKGKQKINDKDIGNISTEKKINFDINNQNQGTKTIKINLGELDLKSKENIKSILLDLGKGKINENNAGLLILDVLSNSKLKQFQNLDKKNVVSVKTDKPVIWHGEINNMNAKISNKNDIAIIDNKDNKIKTEDKGISKNNVNMKEIKKAGEKNNIVKENSKDIDPKEIRSEIRLDLNDLKSVSQNNTKEKTIDSAKEILNDNKEKIFDSIAKNTKIILANNETKFSTMIRPENFGRIDLKFTVKDGKIEGKMILQNQEAADFFKANVEELKAVFNKSNVEMGNIDIALAGQNLSNQNGSSGNNPDNGSKIDFLQNISKATKKFDDNNVLEFINNNNIYNNSMVNIFI